MKKPYTDMNLSVGWLKKDLARASARLKAWTDGQLPAFGNFSYENEHDGWDVDLCVHDDGKISLNVVHEERQLTLTFDRDGRVSFEHETSLEEIEEYVREVTGHAGERDEALGVARKDGEG